MKVQGMPSEKLNNSKSTILILVAMFTTGFSGWLFLSPVIFGSAIFWIGAVLMGIPSYVAGENLGSFGLDSRFANKLSSSARIMFGVFWILFCLLVYGVVLGFLSPMVVE
jgi:hypothetical protein